MFQGTDTEAPFGGGHGEKMFKSFLTDALAQQMSKAGGVGIADVVAKEMLKLQGLTEAPQSGVSG
jgi:Rod binding domain-containing protein